MFPEEILKSASTVRFRDKVTEEHCERCDRVSFPPTSSARPVNSTKTSKQPSLTPLTVSDNAVQSMVKAAKTDEDQLQDVIGDSCDGHCVVVNELPAYMSFYHNCATPASVMRVVTRCSLQQRLLMPRNELS